MGDPVKEWENATLDIANVTRYRIYNPYQVNYRGPMGSFSEDARILWGLCGLLVLPLDLPDIFIRTAAVPAAPPVVSPGKVVFAGAELLQPTSRE